MSTGAPDPPTSGPPTSTTTSSAFAPPTPLGYPPHLIPPPQLTALCTSWLAEDCPSFDAGGYVVGSAPATAHLLAKTLPCVLAGAPFVDEVFRQLGCSVEWHFGEGAVLDGVAPLRVATVRGPARLLLLGERPALNCLARTAGIATATAALLALLRRAGFAGSLAGTRKTTPGFRAPEKYALRVGGADPHRHDLAGMAMVKDNHVWACGGDIARAVAAAREAVGFSAKVEVECRDAAEARRAVEAGADVVMLDNFAPAEAVRVAGELRREFGAGRFLVEVSGGLTEGNIAAYAGGGEGGKGGVDVISTSAIHQGVRHADFSLKVVPRRRESLATLPGGEAEGDAGGGRVPAAAAAVAGEEKGDMNLM